MIGNRQYQEDTDVLEVRKDKRRVRWLIVLVGTCLISTHASGQIQTLEVCLQNNQTRVTSTAEQVAGKIFDGINVHVNWDTGARHCTTDKPSVIVNYNHDRPPDSLDPNALAYSVLRSPVHVEVMYRRVMALNSSDDITRGRYLGYVLVHEIAHILQGYARHSDFGIMKASWNRLDVTQIVQLQLSFTDFDAYLIHHAIDTWSDRRIVNGSRTLFY